MNPDDPPGELDEIPTEYRQESRVEPPRSLSRRFFEAVLADWVRALSLVIVVGVVLMAVFAPLVAPYDPDRTYDLFQPPDGESVGDFDGDGTEETVYHPLGTDSFGHDVLSRVIFGARVSLLVAFATVSLAGVAGTAIGLVAGYFGGWLDNALMRYVDFQWAFPEIVLAIGIIAFIGGLGVVNVVIAIGLAYLDDFARVVRGEVLSVREAEYIKAARTVGMGEVRILAREVLPNASAPIIVQATVLFPLAILSEAALSFLGLGVEPTTPTWGLLISNGQGYITAQWWISVMPGVAIMVTALSFNVLGDALRDGFDVGSDGVKP